MIPAAQDDQGDLAALVAAIEMLSGSGESRQGGDGDVVAKQERRRSRAAAATVQDDVVDADAQRCVDVIFQVLGGELEADGDAARTLADLVGEVPEAVLVVPLRKAPVRRPAAPPPDCALRRSSPSLLCPEDARRYRFWRPGRP